MKTPAIIFVVSFLVILLNVAHVESKTSGNYHDYHLFVFGDSYADTGNIQKNNLSVTSRQWYSPYGRSTVLGLLSGRLSDGLLQTDFIVTMMKIQAPSPYRRRFSFEGHDGLNFAHGGAGVYEMPHQAPTLSMQIDNFKKLIDDDSRAFRLFDLEQSVALVAISGKDYERVANMSSVEEMIPFIGDVTSEIVKGVKRLHELGVSKVLVNNMHPAGCTPWQTRPLNYTKCDGKGNMLAEFHNRDLNKKLNARNSVNVYVVDLNRAFSSIINPLDSSTSPQVAKEFTHKLKPCCRSFDPNGYCGQVDEDGKPQYSVCDNPERHFYWDDVHPSQAGWDAIMGQLERDIRDFLDISY